MLCPQSGDGDSSLVSGGKSTTRNELSYTVSGTPAHQDDSLKCAQLQLPNELSFGRNGCLLGSGGRVLLGDDALVFAKGEMPIEPDNKPVLTTEGALVSVNQSCTFTQRT